MIICPDKLDVVGNELIQDTRTILAALCREWLVLH